MIALLERAGIAVETVATYLLDSEEHKISVPCILDGVPIQMSFSASHPAWSERVRAHLHVCFAGERRWSVYEGGGGFHASKIATRITTELRAIKNAYDERLDRIRKQRLAEQNLAELAATFGATTQDTLTLIKDTVEIVALPDRPSEVRVTLRTSHANVARIVEEFGKTASARKKP